jgi:hypothetical protein
LHKPEELKDATSAKRSAMAEGVTKADGVKGTLWEKGFVNIEQATRTTSTR